MATDVFDLYARLLIDTSKYESGLSKAKGMATSAGSAIGSGIAKATKIATAALAASATAVTAFTKNAVQTGLSFDQVMGEVAATSGKTAEELDKDIGKVSTTYGDFEGTLRDFALFMGKNTKFTATQAGQALNYMALAGYSAQESMEMLPTVLNMAAAGAMDLGRASDMVTDISSAMGLSVKEDAGRIALMADEFAKAASSGNTTVEMLGEAFLTVGGLAKEINTGTVTLSNGTQAQVDNLQQLEIAFTAMANAGIKGSEAGTHMRNMILKLTNPTKQGTEALEAMGLSMYDAQGNMKSLDVIFSSLSEKLGQMTQQQKLSVIGDLFNARDTASAEALLAAMEQDWDRLGESILDAQGAADQMSKTKMDNLQGSLEYMKSALEVMKIRIADQITPSLKGVVDWGTKAVSQLTESFEKGGLSAVMEDIGGFLSDGLNKAIEKLPSLSNTARKLLSTLGRGLLDNIDIVAEAAKTVLTDVVGIVIDSAPGVFTFIGEFLTKIGSWVMENSGMILNGIENVVGIIVDFVANNAGAFIAGLIQLRTKIVQRLPDIIKPIAKALPQIIKDMTKALVDNLPMLIQALTQVVYELVPYLPDIISAIVVAIPQLFTTIVHAIVECLPQLLAAVVELVAGLVAHLPEILGEIVGAVASIGADIIGLVMPFSGDFKKALTNIDLGGFVKDGLTEVYNIAKGIFGWFGTLMNDPAQGIKDAISGIKSFGIKVFN